MAFYLPSFFFFNDTATTEIYTLSLHDALPIFFSLPLEVVRRRQGIERATSRLFERSEEHTSELQSRLHLVCRLLLEKKKKKPMLVASQHHTSDLRRVTQLVRLSQLITVTVVLT